VLPAKVQEVRLRAVRISSQKQPPDAAAFPSSVAPSMARDAAVVRLAAAPSLEAQLRLISVPLTEAVGKVAHRQAAPREGPAATGCTGDSVSG